jgi:hypothetical protein
VVALVSTHPKLRAARDLKRQRRRRAVDIVLAIAALIGFALVILL